MPPTPSPSPPATPQGQLSRELGLGSAFCVVSGSVIGSGVFLVASDISRALPSAGMALGVWVVAGLLSFMGGLLFAELGSRYPQAGGQYVYLKEAFHPLLGFLYGWTLMLVIQSGSIAAVAIAFSTFASRLFPVSEWFLKVGATGAIVALTLWNTQGVKQGARLLDLLTSLKILALVGFSVAGFLIPASAVPATAAPASLDLSAFGVALIAAFWAYDGWNNVTFVAGEIRQPRRNLPWALGLGVLAVTTLYVLVNSTYYGVLSPAQVAGSSFVAADAAQRLAGPVGVRIVTLLVVISALGCLNGMILSGSRVIYAMAKDGCLPEPLARIHPRFRSPNAALYLQGLWTCLLVWSGTYDQLFTYVIFAASLFYGLTAAALMRLRGRPGGEPDAYRAPAYPYLPLVYMISIGVFTLNALVERPWESLAGAGIILAGVPAFYYFTRRPAYGTAPRGF